MESRKTDTLRRIELTEGVEIRLRMAGPMVRCYAWLIDLVIRIGIYMVFGFAVHLISIPFGFNVGEGLFLLFVFFMEWFYFVLFERGKKGATPGKRALKVRVCKPSGAPISLNQAVLRNLMRWADFLPFGYLLGLMSCLFTRNFQRMGDLVAGTVVVYRDDVEHASLAVPPTIVPVMPRVALSREEQGAMVEFLERGESWSDARKVELANHLEPVAQCRGPQAVQEVQGMAAWIRQDR